MNCPAGSEYKPSMSACGTCRDENEECKPNVEGCECKDGWLKNSDNRCVKKEQCGCMKDGNYFEVCRVRSRFLFRLFISKWGGGKEARGWPGLKIDPCTKCHFIWGLKGAGVGAGAGVLTDGAQAPLPPLSGYVFVDCTTWVSSTYDTPFVTKFFNYFWNSNCHCHICNQRKNSIQMSLNKLSIDSAIQIIL